MPAPPPLPASTSTHPSLPPPPPPTAPRPDYKELSLFKRRWPGVPLLALTATATPRVQEDVRLQLRIPNCVVFKSSFNRTNLRQAREGQAREGRGRAQAARACCTAVRSW